MKAPGSWYKAVPLPSESLNELRRRAIFECCKWDPQVEDVDTLAPMAVVLKESTWLELARMAEGLSAETIALENELGQRPDLHRALAIPGAIRTTLTEATAGLSARDVRVMRFDFHPTANGWQVTEVNSDVPGGYNEASGWTGLVAEHVSNAAPCADTAEILATAIQKTLPANSAVALVHATAYTDDRQVMTFLGDKIRARGLRPVLAGPDHIEWEAGSASVNTTWYTGSIDLVFRFFPAEWLPNLGPRNKWKPFFAGHTPLCNPATALLTQTKRWPLVKHELQTNTPLWMTLMPETRDPGEVDWRGSDEWVIKPALGRVGELIGITGVTCATDWKAILPSVRWWGARHWVAQRRFEPTPVIANGKSWHICLGVYTVNGRAAGIYGRLADKPLINHLARDVAVLVERKEI